MKKKSKEVAINIVVPRELRQVLKARAAVLEITLNALMVNILQANIEKNAA